MDAQVHGTLLCCALCIHLRELETCSCAPLRNAQRTRCDPRCALAVAQNQYVNRCRGAETVNGEMRRCRSYNSHASAPSLALDSTPFAGSLRERRDSTRDLPRDRPRNGRHDSSRNEPKRSQWQGIRWKPGRWPPRPCTPFPDRPAPSSPIAGSSIKATRQSAAPCKPSGSDDRRHRRCPTDAVTCARQRAASD
jgi:hypothetical protein